MRQFHKANHVLDRMFTTDPAYSPPAEFEHGKYVLVGRFEGDGDGQDAEVYEARYPASFWKVRAYDRENTVGKLNRGFALEFGSGDGRLPFTIAREISQGMLGLAEETDNE